MHRVVAPFLNFALIRAALCGAFVLVGAVLSPAFSEGPPSSCVRLFTGRWTSTVHATGETFPTVVRPDGTLTSDCPACVGQQTWTCSGRTFNLLTPPVTASLSDDGRTLSSSCCTMSRSSGASASVDSRKNEKRPRGSANDPHGPEAIAEHEADILMLQARALERDLRTSSRAYAEQEWQQAINRYNSAAERYEIAGDHEKARLATEQENRLRNSKLVSNSKAAGENKKYSAAQCHDLRAQVAVIRKNGGDSAGLETSINQQCN
jgi:hypothetical protein